MRSAGRLSVAYLGIEEDKKLDEIRRKESMLAMQAEQERRLTENELSKSQQDDQHSIADERKNILEKISK